MNEPLAIGVASWDHPFDDEQALLNLSAILPAYISARRWYRGKARTMQRLTIQDLLPADSEAFILVLGIEYEDGAHDEYVLPAIVARPGAAASSDDLICSLRAADGSEGSLYSALSNAAFRQALLDTVVRDGAFEGQHGNLVGHHTKALEAIGGPAAGFESFVSRAEQSNTSIIYGDRYILKLFRKLEEGVNPDVEVGNFLTRRGFKHTPAVLGSLEYNTENGESHPAGILQQFVPNQGDAWSYTLRSLGGFFERARAGKVKLQTRHPLELAAKEMPAHTHELLGDYVDSAALLGKRTAQMHAAFEDENAGQDFIPEPFTPQDGEALYRELLSQADIAFELLRRKQPMLTGVAAEAGREVLRLEPEVMNRFGALHESRVTAVRIRHHGDYHLGQVLYTGTDFMIIDFEGEPTRTLPERRKKALAMRDVAGMLRSFQYAAFSALFATGPDVPAEPGRRSAVELAAFWTAWTGATYVRAYFAEAGGLRCVPSEIGERRLLLDVFLLQKALYEMVYELNNRPDWVRIPLRGILSLVSEP